MYQRAPRLDHARLVMGLVALAVGFVPAGRADSPNDSRPYGLTHRIAAKPYLNMPARADGKIPLLLSQTGAFSDTRNRIPSKALIPYDLIVAFWSDGAIKTRWVAIPAKQIKFSGTGQWTFPAGTVFVKNFDLPIDAAAPNVKRRLETRLLVRDSTGGVYGVTYKWRADESDADLLPGSLLEDI
jgi:hypothetical protein